eukprot:CAMPEP_0172495956 /NCGR_PEP_ID=MMETSP1066-20121228/79756_1 /TAXON_ID=671091 /ORGANISM="Coscinodiscus wailesii, Strain CCMP2513" /LENGTH=112 /DNA_ID=CAMNT_0013267987 /DNA_START=397 /DNA_END=735 /DNA_ORIENTATION=-
MEMIDAARHNIKMYNDRAADDDGDENDGHDASNIDIVNAVIDDPNVPLLEPNVAHVVISNGVFNLCPDKKTAFANAFRVLRPGGRFLLSDLCSVEANLLALVTCSLGDDWSS